MCNKYIYDKGVDGWVVGSFLIHGFFWGVDNCLPRIFLKI